MRLVLVSWVAGLAGLPDAGGWRAPVVVVGLGCLFLDGVDGRLARRRSLVSSFGARFDLEVDAALVLVLSCAVVAAGVAGWWALAIGLVRYCYVGASLRWPWLRGALFPSRARKAVGAGVVVTLLLTLAPSSLPHLPPGPDQALLGLALTALCWSFGRDARWQHAHRQGAGRREIPT